MLSLFCKVKNTNFRRRTLKNRGYAASCRIKRLEQKDELESEKGKEFEDLDKMQVEIQVTAFRFYRIKYYIQHSDKHTDIIAEITLDIGHIFLPQWKAEV